MNHNTQQSIDSESKAHRAPILIFSIMTLTNILINLDHGIMPACTNELKQTYDMGQTELGFLGSIVYLGIVMMGTFAGQLYQRINSKLLSVIALAALEASLVLFVLSENKILAYICRYLTGACQVFLLVYYPVWIDKFGENKKTLWLTLLQICVPVGIFMGYGMTAVIINLKGSVISNFKYSFYIQIGLVGIFLVIFALMSKSKLDCRRKEQQEFSQSFVGRLNKPLTENLMPSQDILPVLPDTDNKKNKIKHTPYLKGMKKLLKSKMYLIGTFTMAAILFVSTGIQFWLTDYFVNVQHFDIAVVNIAYGVVSITGPTSGCAFGGFIINLKGGYENPRSIYYLFLFSIIGIGSAVVIPFVDNFYVAASLLWLVLFFGGAMMPGLTGIMMVSVPPHLRAFGNSNGQIVKNIFGYLPAPFSYGWFNYMFDDPKAGIKLIMFWGLWVPFLVALGCVYRYRQLKNKSKKEIKKSLDQQIKHIDQSEEVEIDEDLDNAEPDSAQKGLISKGKRSNSFQQDNIQNQDDSLEDQSPKRKGSGKNTKKEYLEDQKNGTRQDLKINPTKEEGSTDQNPPFEGFNGKFLP